MSYLSEANERRIEKISSFYENCCPGRKDLVEEKLRERED